jgi:hypothetical protein
MSEAQLDVTVRNQKNNYSQGTGEKIGVTRRVFAQFSKGGVPDWALATAEETFKMGGKPPEIPPSMWLSTYDSRGDQFARGWTEEEHTLIVEKLRNTGGVVEITLPKTKAPYAKYDQHRRTHGRRTVETVIKDIQSVYESAGFDVPQAVRYERENLNDETVVAALEALESQTDEVEEQVVAA